MRDRGFGIELIKDTHENYTHTGTMREIFLEHVFNSIQVDFFVLFVLKFGMYGTILGSKVSSDNYHMADGMRAT